jgi:RND family efflux transporter MFP subunit
MSRRFWLVAAVLALIAALLVAGRGGDDEPAASGPSPAVNATAEPSEPLAPVTVIQVQGGSADASLPLTATVTTERSAALSPRVSGLVSALHVDAGDRVSAGKVLLELDPALVRIALQRAGAALEEAQTAFAEAKRQYEEARELVDRRLVPATRLPAAEAAMNVASAAVERLRSEQREQAELLRRHTVVAPFPGVISRRSAEVGEWVETGTPVLELVDTERLRVDVQVPQERYAVVQTGTAVEVRLDALRDRVLEGRVATKVPVKDPNARTFLARIEVDDAARYMTPGMSARVWFALDAGAQAAVSVPRDAVVRQPDGTSIVWVVNGEGATPFVSPRRIEVGASLSDRIEIQRGLEPGTVVVLRGNETLKDGQRVRLLAPSAVAGS